MQEHIVHPITPIAAAPRVRLAILMRPIVIALGAALSAFVLYLVTMSPTVGFIDSGELTTVLDKLGIAHPPGYPLYTLLGWLFTRIPIGTVAWRVNVLSAIFAAAGVGLTYVATRDVLLWMRDRTGGDAEVAARRLSSGPRGREPAPKTVARGRGRERRGAPVARPEKLAPVWLPLPVEGPALLAAALLAVSATFWWWATQAKMYTLHALFFTAVLLIMLRWRAAYARGEPTEARRWLIVLAAAIGLSFTNHPTTVLWLPGIVVFVAWVIAAKIGFQLRRFRLRSPAGEWKPNASVILACLLALIVPLALYIYVPVRAAQHPVMNWGDPDTLHRFWRHVSGWQYRSEFLSQPFDQVMQNLRDGIVLLGSQWTLIPLLLGLPGIYALWRHDRPLLVFALITTLVIIFQNINYIHVEYDAYYLPVIVLLALVMAVGAAWLIRLVRSRSPGTGMARALLICGAILIALPFGVNVLQDNRHNDYLAPDFVSNAFASVAPHALIISADWDLVSPSYYAQYVEGRRRDVTIVDTLQMRYGYYFLYLQEHYPGLLRGSKGPLDRYLAERARWDNGQSYNADILQNDYMALINSFITKSLPHRPVYIDYTVDPGVGAGLNRVPSGLFFRLLPSGGTAHTVAPHFRLRGMLDGTVYVDQYQRQTKQLYATALFNEGIGLAHDGKKQVALSALRESLALGPSDPARVKSLIQQIEAMPSGRSR